MHSYTAIATFALGLLTMTKPALALADGTADLSARADFADSLFARASLEKRRPNHAAAYGYPFGLPKPKGPRKPMTPGGYKDPRKPNQGAVCKKDNQCTTTVPLGAGICQAGKCSFRCLGDTIKSNGACIGEFKAPQCNYDHNCRTKIANAWPVCNDKKCTFECKTGYHAEGNSCVRDQSTCRGVKCPPVQNGSNFCVSGKCTPQCNTHLGYYLFSNAKKTAYKCINTQVDPENCGRANNMCPEGYNGRGHPICVRGSCSLQCDGGRPPRRTNNGRFYCAL